MRLFKSPSSLPGLAPLACLAAVALGLPSALLACWPTTGGSTSGNGSSAAALPTTDPPVITDLSMSASVLTATNGVYTVTGVITYSDDNDVVSKFQVQVPVLGKTYTFPVDNPVAAGYGEPIAFTLSADAPLGGAGPTNYILTLVNSGGAVSAGIEESMDLE